MRKFIVILLLCVLLRDTVEAKMKDTTWVGDSRFVGMSYISNENYLAEVGKGYEWVRYKSISTDKVVVNLGVNDLGNVEKYKKWLEKLAKSHTVYFVSVNPVSGRCSVTNKQIRTFNKSVRKVKGVHYIGCYSYLKKNGYTTTDGLHYDSATNKRIYKYIKKRIKKYESRSS